MFRFRLRTMLVGVAVLAVPIAWVGYSLRWIKERHAWLECNDGLTMMEAHTEMLDGTGRLIKVPVEVKAPGGLWLFGERGHHEFMFWNEPHPNANTEQARRLFPEAKIAE